MKIAVFGATGQIGRAICRVLVDSHHDVRALVRRSNVALPAQVKTELVPEYDEAAMARILEGADLAVYAIGMAEQWVPDPSIFQRVNVELFEHFLQAMQRAAVAALMYVSTFEVFANKQGRIRERNPLADPSSFSPYYRSMFDAYRRALEAAQEQSLRLVTLHPAAAYGGRNTGLGLTNYLHNLLHRRIWRVPFIPPTQFPLAHVDSIAEVARRALNGRGAFIVSDGMSSLRGVARALRSHGRGFIPPAAPLALARAAASGFELLADWSGRPPLMAHVQLDYLTAEHQPSSDKAQRELGWEPVPLIEGVGRWLAKQEYKARPRMRIATKV